MMHGMRDPQVIQADVALGAVSGRVGDPQPDQDRVAMTRDQLLPRWLDARDTLIVPALDARRCFLANANLRGAGPNSAAAGAKLSSRAVSSTSAIPRSGQEPDQPACGTRSGATAVAKLFLSAGPVRLRAPMNQDGAAVAVAA
jgi:hypothetical protein